MTDPAWEDRMRGVALVGLVLVLITAGIPASVGSAEEEEPLRLRFFEAGALGSERSYYLAESPPPSPDSTAEAWPFGLESEYGHLPLGTIDEVIEQVKMELAHLGGWEDDHDVDLRGVGDLLVLKSRRSLVQAVAARLAAYEREVLSTTTTEVRCVRVRIDGTDTPEEASSSPADAGPSLVLTAPPGQQAAGFAGAQVTYLARYDGSETTEASLDPVTEVANVGLMLSVTTARTDTPGRILVELRGYLVTGPATFRTVSLPGAQVVEVPEWSVTRLRSETIVEAGAWSRLDVASADAKTKSRWTLRLRVHENPYAAMVGPLPLPAFETGPDREDGPPASAWIDTAAVSQFGGRCIWFPDIRPHLFASHLPYPDGGGVGCSGELLSLGVLENVLRDSFPPDTWEQPDRVLDTRSGRLSVTGPAPLVRTVEARARALLKTFTWAHSTRAAIVEVPDELAAELLERPAARNGAPLLGRRGGAILTQAEKEGRARWLDELTVTAVGHSGAVVRSGRRTTYIADHDIIVNEHGARAKAVQAEAFGGFVLDVRPTLTGGRAAAFLDLRAFRSEVPKPIRQIKTPHGPVELPTMEVLRIRTSLVVPFGETAIAGAASAEGRTRLLLVTPELRTP